MSSGVEVMISHAENLSRHLERVREDLNELRHKERLATDEPVTPGPLANGSTRFGKIRRMFTFVDNLRVWFSATMLSTGVLHLSIALLSLDPHNLQLHCLLGLGTLFCCSFFCPLYQP